MQLQPSSPSQQTHSRRRFQPRNESESAGNPLGNSYKTTTRHDVVWCTTWPQFFRTLRARYTDISHRRNVCLRLRVILLSVLDEIFLPRVTLGAGLTASSHCTGEGCEVVGVLHVFRVFRLCFGWLGADLFFATEGFEVVVPVVQATRKVADRRCLILSTPARHDIFDLSLSFELVVAAHML